MSTDKNRLPAVRPSTRLAEYPSFGCVIITYVSTKVGCVQEAWEKKDTLLQVGFCGWLCGLANVGAFVCRLVWIEGVTQVRKSSIHFQNQVQRQARLHHQFVRSLYNCRKWKMTCKKAQALKNRITSSRRSEWFRD